MNTVEGALLLAELAVARGRVVELEGRIEAADLMFRTHFETAGWVNTYTFEKVSDALYVLAGEPDGADL